MCSLTGSLSLQSPDWPPFANRMIVSGFLVGQKSGIMKDAAQEHFACYRDEDDPETKLERNRLARQLKAMGIQYKSLCVGCDGSCSLNLSGTPIADLAPLKDVPVTRLCLQGCYRITDVSPLESTKVAWLNIARTRVMDLSPLRDLPLTDLILHRTQIASLAPLRDTSLRSLDIRSTRITDVSPLRHVPLSELLFFPARVTKGLAVLRGIETLKKINRRPTADFWKQYGGSAEAQNKSRQT